MIKEDAICSYSPYGGEEIMRIFARKIHGDKRSEKEK